MYRLSIVLYLLPLFAFGQTTLSDSATISVITCGPWQEELYSAFGHSAFRVYDPKNNIDEAYNYGVFDFDQPNFYLNFARGFLYYKLGVYSYPRFRDYYIYHNRYVHEQVLNLNEAERNKVYAYLQWNALPENASYRYDYFYDNCATKIRDVVKASLGEDVVFDGSFIKTNYSIRDLTDIYLVHQPWGDLGIDICLGLPMDKVASPYEYMFLPDYVEASFDHATLTGKPLVRSKSVVYQQRTEPLPNPISPFLIFSVVAGAALLISFLDFRRQKLSTWFDATLFSLAGAIGLLLVFLWFGTDHKAAAKNFNMLWALPTHLIAVVTFIKSPGWLKHYFLGVSILMALLLIAWTFLPQALNSALFPVVIALGVRAFAQYAFRANVWKRADLQV